MTFIVLFQAKMQIIILVYLLHFDILNRIYVILKPDKKKQKTDTYTT